MVVIGLENVLVLTKSVVSTPVDLEVKLRIAQGEDRACLSLFVYDKTIYQIHIHHYIYNFTSHQIIILFFCLASKMISF